MNLLTIDNLTKAYSERTLLDRASFHIQDQEKIGVIGTNGMGKSTLLKILAGIEEPDDGEVIMGNHIRMGYLPQLPVFEEGYSILEGALGKKKKESVDLTLENEAKSMLFQLGFQNLSQHMEELSGGQKKRVALVKVLLEPVDILILDEPTNHLDNQMSQWLEDYLVNYKGALVMVTHDRYFLDRISTRIVEVDHGNIYSYPGNYSEYVRLKEARQSSEAATERKRQSLLRTELEWLARGARARSTKQKAHIQRIEDMQKQTGPREEQNVQMNSLSSRMGRKTIELEHISKAFGEHVLIEDYSYIFLKADRIGIIGPNGCGKSTLMKMIYGSEQPDSGIIEIGQTIKIGYFSQENEYMDDRLKAIDYIKEVAEFIHTRDGLVSASNMMERFLFDGTMQWTKIEKLSGGEKRRLYLLRILMGAPNVLILDEPTNDLDIQTLTILEDYLDTFDGIVITVSHDRYFLDRVVRRIFAFEDSGQLVQYEGGYSDYQIALEIKNYEATHVGSDNSVEPVKEKTQKVKDKKLKFSYKEAREYETIDEDIASLEEKIELLGKKMEENASSYSKLNEIMEEKQAAEKALEEKMDRWVYLNDLAEQIESENQ